MLLAFCLSEKAAAAKDEDAALGTATVLLSSVNCLLIALEALTDLSTVIITLRREATNEKSFCLYVANGVEAIVRCGNVDTTLFDVGSTTPEVSG